MNRAFQPFVESVATGEAPPAGLAERARSLIQRDLDARRRRLRKSLPRRKAKAADREEESGARKIMWVQVWAWNLAHTRGPGAPFGRCDCGCAYAFRHGQEGELDHWIELSQGGESTRENGWRLRAECHQAKHDEQPPAGNAKDLPARPLWNAAREAYCARAEIPFVPRRVKP